LYSDNEGKLGDQIEPSSTVWFSTRQTCGECHSYDVISSGWHFNAYDSNSPPGRNGEPWIYFNSEFYIQIPLSYRQWSGVYSPEDIGRSTYNMTRVFGRAMPGGGIGEVKATGSDVGDQMASGMLEINCFACHNDHYGQDMGGENGWAMQVAKKNFRWAATGSTEFANVSGAINLMTAIYDPLFPSMDENEPKVSYRESFFNKDNNVLLNIVREAPEVRCYFCHSELYQKTNVEDEDPDKWTQDVDIHLTAGLTCVDCHRNGGDHNITRGYEGEELVSDNEMVSVSTCKGCHLPEDDGHDGPIPEAGRLGAPIPEHKGIPTVHFDSLTCTACHSGSWPKQQTDLARTSRNHKLNVVGSSKGQYSLPHIVSPVFAAGEDGKIGPYRAVWPSFWATIEDGSIVPMEIPPEEKGKGALQRVLESLFPASEDRDPDEFTEGWWNLTDEMLTDALTSLSASVDANVVYISGGNLYRLDANDLAVEYDHPDAEPYLWAIGHNVRPAAQALGVRYCTDCHSQEAALFFGEVAVDTPIVSQRGTVREMIEFQDINRFYAWAFSESFIFRPWLKIIALACCAVIAAVLLLYALRALGCIAKAADGGK